MRTYGYILVFVLLTLCGCNRNFMSDRQYLQMVENDFTARAQILEAAEVDLDAMDLSGK